jgi:hypothetical protein
MDSNILFQNNSIAVTPAVARFGPASYQIATITSVAVYHRQKLSPMAVMLVTAAVGLVTFGYLGREQYPEYSMWSAIAAPVALILGVGWQRFRPALEYSFMMKTAGGEAETVTSRDRDQVFELKEAIESAFALQGRSDRSGTIRVESPTTANAHPDDAPYITRDWVVANAGAMR